MTKMQKLVAFIPNMFTLGNLLCGCIGIIFAFQGKPEWSFFMILLAAFLDFFDGFFARILKVSGELGKQLDSLADGVSFGVLPAIMMFLFVEHQFDFLGYYCMYDSYMQAGEMLSEGSNAQCGFSYDPNQFNLLSYFSLCIALFSIYRLAKFNIDSRQSSGFIGLPTPANAIFISSFIFAFYFFTDQVSFFGTEGFTIYPPLSIEATVNFPPQLMLNWHSSSSVFKLIFNPYTALAISFVFSVLLVSEIPLFALKFKNFGWNDNKIRYLFLLLSLVMLILFHLIALPFIVILYIVISILNNLFKITV